MGVVFVANLAAFGLKVLGVAEKWAVGVVLFAALAEPPLWQP